MKGSLKKNISTPFLLIFGALALCAIGLRIWQFHWQSTQVTLANQELTVLVARTPKQLRQGLGRRDVMSKDGMLFLFPYPRKVGIVMRDMRFPLDIVWLGEGKVVDIAPNVATEPGVAEAGLKVYYPRYEASMVLELPAGWASAHGLKIGDTIAVPE